MRLMDPPPSCEISIHPPREGWDKQQAYITAYNEISIHPPREGWDDVHHGDRRTAYNFNPPTPRGV